MSTSAFISRWSRWLPILLTGWFVTGAVAGSVRITTLDLSAVTTQTADQDVVDEARLVHDAVRKLNLLRPDVIILQHVRDWRMSSDLAEALKPVEYQVAVCSDFKDAAHATNNASLVAVLTRRRAYFSWSEGWGNAGTGAGEAPGGFAFAAISYPGQGRLGVFVLQVDASVLKNAEGTAQSREAAVEKWLQTVDSFKDWVNNRIGVAVVAGSVMGPAPTSASPEDRELALKLWGAPLEQPTLLSDSKASDDGRQNFLRVKITANADKLPGVVLDRWPATCDIEFVGEAAGNHATPAPVAAVPANVPVPAVTIPAPPPTPAAVVSSQRPPQNPAVPPRRDWIVVVAAVGGFALLSGILWWRISRQYPPISSTRTLIAVGSDSGRQEGPADALVIVPNSVTGSAAQDPGALPANRPIIHVETPGTDSYEEWKRRATAAEKDADEARKAMRDGVIPHLAEWLKARLTRKLAAERAELLEVQQTAAWKAMALDERLARIEEQIQRQTAAYEQRIEELNRELAVAKEENRALILQRISEVRSEMETARAQALAKAKQQS